MVAFNTDLFFGITIGFVSYIMLYMGKGIQKYAIEGFKEDKTIKSKHSGTWIFGTALTTSFMFIQWIPLTVFHTPMNLIAPLEGIGIVSLFVFSYFVLKEPFSKYEITGALIIIIGTVLINVVARAPEELQREEFKLISFLIALGVILLPTIILSIFVFRKPSFIKGVLLGLTAGSFMALQTLTKRITDINELALIFTFVTFAIATITLALTQFAFTMARANIVVPCFASMSIILTIVLGTFTINEQIMPIQIAGIVCIVAGIIIINLKIIFFKEEKEETQILSSSAQEEL
jgi:multidrug transporter EmrE-like cation transporter